jgi:hypothetical protein
MMAFIQEEDNEADYDGSHAFCVRGFVVLNSLLSWLFKLFLFVMALAFFAGLLVLLLLSLVVSLSRWVFTGRPPQVKVVMQRYKGWQSKNPLHRRRPTQTDVVDAEVREIPPHRLDDKR